MKMKSRLEPREIGEHAWYYADERSIDLLVEPTAYPDASHTKLSEARLRQMLADLRPKRRRGTGGAG